LESIAYSGIALNLVVYLGKVLHGTTASNAANVDAWNGATFLTPVLGAFLADTYWGKYKTTAISIIFYVVVSADTILVLYQYSCSMYHFLSLQHSDMYLACPQLGVACNYRLCCHSIPAASFM
jgi:dipeptide/tripeptide permease